MSWHIEFVAINKDEARGAINMAMGREKVPMPIADQLRDLVDSLIDIADPRTPHAILVKSNGHIGSGPMGTTLSASITSEVRWIPRDA